MPDDSAYNIAGYGLSLLGGGGLTAGVVKMIFGGISRRLDKIEETLEKLVNTQNERHEKTIRDVGRVEDRANAAFAKYDALKAVVEELKATVKEIEHESRQVHSRRARR